MGKLKNIGAALPALSSPLVFARDQHGHNSQAEPWRKWYSLARWKILRMATFKRDRFRCQCGQSDCGRVESNTRLLVCDHIKRHGGDPVLFWDPTNLQTLLKTCHDRIKQAEERRAPWQR